MESLDELRKAIEELQSRVKPLQDTFPNSQKYKNLDDVGRDVANLSKESVYLLNRRWQLLHGYLNERFSGVQERSAPLNTSDWRDKTKEAVLNNIGDLFKDLFKGEINSENVLELSVNSVSLSLATVLNHRQMKYYIVNVPDVKCLQFVDRILNDRRDQQKWADYLQTILNFWGEYIKADPKGAVELVKDVGELLCDQLGEFTATVEEFLEGVVFIVAQILGQILKWTREKGGDIVEWVKGNWPEVEEFLAQLADLVIQLFAWIADLIEQNAGSVVMAMGLVLVVVLNILQTSQVSLKDRKMSEND